MGAEPSQRISYLLRLWKVPDDEGGHWYALLEDPVTGQRIGFKGIHALTAFLHALTHDPFPSNHRNGAA